MSVNSLRTTSAELIVAVVKDIVLSLGMLQTEVGARIVAGRSYRCKRCQHSWGYEEPQPGDVPGACPKCFDMNFDNAYKARGRDGNQKNWKTDVWEGAFLGERASREWDF